MGKSRSIGSGTAIEPAEADYDQNTGEYEFNTDDKEIIEIISGDLAVSLPEEEGWKTIKDGEAFEVPAQSKFGLRVKRITDYCCSFFG